MNYGERYKTGVYGLASGSPVRLVCIGFESVLRWVIPDRPVGLVVMARPGFNNGSVAPRSCSCVIFPPIHWR